MHDVMVSVCVLMSMTKVKVLKCDNYESSELMTLDNLQPFNTD